MAYTTTTTSITSATSSRSKQATVYQYPTGNGVVITGASVNSNTTAYLGVTTPGAAQTYTAVSGGATITEIVYLDSDNVPTNANAVSTTGGNIKIVGTGFASNSQVYINNALVTNTVPNSTAIIATLTTGSVGNVSCYIFGSGNSGGAISANSVRFSGAPSWVTAAAVSSVNGIASNIALQASGDGTLTYVLKSGSGSLPTGITLLSNGYLTGTATGYSADTVVTFTLIVRDTENQATQQTFNYTVFIGDTYFKQTSLLLSATVSNTFISDSSTNNFLITRNGDTRPSRLSPYWPGGWSAFFDGSGDYLTVAHNTGFDFGTGDFTIEFWLYQSVQNTDTFLVDTYFFSGSTEFGWQVSLQAQGKLIFATMASGGGSPSATITSASAMTVSKWVHCAAVRSGTTVTLYIDGLSAGSGTVSTNIAYTRPLQIAAGGYYNGPYLYFFNGYLSNIRILKGTALYTANFTPSTTSLTTIANTSVLLLRDSILVDDSPYNGLVTRGGDTKLLTFSPFNTAPHTITANTNSVYFDGTGDYLSVADNSELNVGTGDFTIEAWVNRLNSMSGAGNGDTIVGKGTNNGILFIYVTGSTIGFSQYGVGALVTSTTVIENGRWYHVAVTRSGTTLRLFVNGVLESTATSSANFTSSTALQIGQDPSNSGQRLNGLISNFRFVKGTAVYTANFTPATSALTAISGTSLLACQANTIIDSNTTPKTITVNGNPNVSLANPFGETVTTIGNYTWTANSYGASAYFDGATATRLSFASNNTFAFGTGAYTLEAWVYLTAYGSPATNLIDCGGATNSIGLSILSSGGLFINKYGTGSVFSTSSAVPLNSWTHVAASRASTGSNDTRLFINGVLAATGTDNNNWTVTTSPSIGGINLAGYTVTGYLSDVRITKGTALYTGPFIPPTAPLPNVANVSLLTLQSDIGSNSAQFVDQSPNNHLITRNGNASQGTYGPLVPSTWSAYFDGTGDYLSLTTNEAFDYGTGNFTIECWFYIAGNSATNNSSHKAAALFSTYPASSTINGYALELGGNASTTGTGLSFASWVSGSAAVVQNNSLTITQNAWHHVAVVRNGTSTTIYYDGGNVASGALSNQNVNTSGNALKIGTMGYAGYIQDFVGYISNARIIKGTAQYTANFTPSTTTISPITNTVLLTLRGPSFTDDSGNNFTITRNGDTKIVPFGPFSPQIVTPDSYSYRFSNASDYISTTSSNLAFGSNNWTIESWVYPRFTANSGVFQVSNVQYGLTNSNLNTVALGFSNSNKAIVRVANATYTSTGTSITANTWTHLALVKSSNVSKLYINGTLDSTIGTSGSITDTVSYTGTTNVAVGGYGSTSALANAYISNFRIVSNSAVYTENFTPAVGPLSAISGTTLLTCQANTIIDSSAANLTITANANVSPSNFNPFDETVTVGQAYSALADGGSAYFDGTGDNLSIPYNSSFVIGTNNFTVECWMYLTSNPNLRNLFGLGNGANGSGPVTSTWQLRYLGTEGSNQIDFTKYDGTTTTSYTTSGAPIVTHSWFHIAVSRTGGTLKIFVNGTAYYSAANTFNYSAVNTSDPFLIGLGYYGPESGLNGPRYFPGYISNIRILIGTGLYAANFVPPAAPALPTTANTSLLLNFTSSGVIDSTGRNVLETVADAKVTTNLKKYGTGSYYFDGTGDYFSLNNYGALYDINNADFTIELWVYPTTFGSTSALISLANVIATGYAAIRFRLTSTGQLQLYISTDGSNWAVSGTSTETISLNTWSHIALTRSGVGSNNIKTFINGTATSLTLTYTGTAYVGGAYCIGAVFSSSTAGELFTGYMDDLRITKGYARYTANFTVPSEPFITK